MYNYKNILNILLNIIIVIIIVFIIVVVVVIIIIIICQLAAYTSTTLVVETKAVQESKPFQLLS